MPILRSHAARLNARHWPRIDQRGGQRGPRAGRFVRFRASGGAKFTQICDSLPWTPMNRRAKFDSARFILLGKIRNRTNKQTSTHTKQ